MPTSRMTYHARWIAPVARPPIKNGFVAVENGWIVEVGSGRPPEGESVDCGDAVLLPGFVNAHTHLELSDCHARIAYRGSFVQWVRDLVSHTRHAACAPGERWPIELGLEASLAAGVTTVADIASTASALAHWRSAAQRVVGYLEVLGMGPKRFEPHQQSFDRFKSLCERSPFSQRCHIGLSPHAPYSVDTEIYQAIVAYIRRSNRPLCTHLAETLQEVEFLTDGAGLFRELLEKWDLWDGSFESPGCSPVEYAERLGLLACGAALIHVNYVSESDLDLLARYRSPVVYCPRSHAFFQHEPHLYPAMLERGINVCLGTDSLASNDSLSILDELRFLRGLDTHLSDDQLLAMGTLAGARALGLDQEIGSLEPGKSADLVAVPLADPGSAEPLEDLLAGRTNPQRVIISGRTVISPAD